MKTDQSLPVDKIAEIRKRQLARLEQMSGDPPRPLSSMQAVESYQDCATLLALLTPDAEKPHEDTAHHANGLDGVTGGTGVGSQSLPHVVPTSKATAVSREELGALVREHERQLIAYAMDVGPCPKIDLTDAILKLIGRRGEEAGTREMYFLGHDGSPDGDWFVVPISQRLAFEKWVRNECPEDYEPVGLHHVMGPEGLTFSDPHWGTEIAAPLTMHPPAEA